MRTHPVYDTLSAYLDRELRPDEELTLASHLEQCPVCRRRLAELTQTGKLVRSLSPVAAPDTLREVLRERLSARTQTVFPRWRVTWPTPLRAAAAVALVFVAVLSIGILREAMPSRTAMDATRPSSPGAVEPVGKSRNFGTPTLSQTDRVMRESLRMGPGAPSAAVGVLIGRQAVRTASLLIEVTDVDSAGADLVVIAEAAGGFVAESTVGTDAGETATFLLRVPASRFSQVLEELENLGRVESRRVGGEDVSEEFVDLRARIRNSERREQQLLSLMGRASRVSDLMAIEQELSRVRGEIEQLTGRLRFLSNRVDLPTVEVKLRKKETPAPE